MNDMIVTSAQWTQDINGNNDVILAVIDGQTLNVPQDNGNRHYQAILDWIADGNTIQDAA